MLLVASTVVYQDGILLSTKLKSLSFMWQGWCCKSIRRSITQIDALCDMHDSPHRGCRLTSHLPSFPINPNLGAQTPTTSMSPLLHLNYFFALPSLPFGRGFTNGKSFKLLIPTPQSSVQSWHTKSARDMIAPRGNKGVSSG